MFNRIKRLAYKHKCKKQREKRGFCDDDIWDISSWFFDIIPKMLGELKKQPHYPKYFIEEAFEENKQKTDMDIYEIIYHTYDEKYQGFVDEIHKIALEKFHQKLNELIFYFEESDKDIYSKQKEALKDIKDEDITDEVLENYYDSCNEIKDNRQDYKKKALELFVECVNNRLI